MFMFFGYIAVFAAGFMTSFFLHRKLVSDMAAMKNDAIATLNAQHNGIVAMRDAIEDDLRARLTKSQQGVEGSVAAPGGPAKRV